ncbi:TRAP transporter small permease [Azospirillum oleiclasticum]|nr:TRAP transporter small permease [Azospirillum oleiclasticum]
MTTPPRTDAIQETAAGGHPAPAARRGIPKLAPEAWAAAALLFTLVVMLTAQVVLRFVFNIGVSWLEEVIRFVFVWSVYASFLVAAEDDRHIRVALHLSWLPQRWQTVMLTLADLVWIAFNLTVVWFGAVYAQSLFEFPYISQTTGINMVWVFLVVPMGFLLLSVRVARFMAKRWRGEATLRDSRLDS